MQVKELLGPRAVETLNVFCDRLMLRHLDVLLAKLLIVVSHTSWHFRECLSLLARNNKDVQILSYICELVLLLNR